MGEAATDGDPVTAPAFPGPRPYPPVVIPTTRRSGIFPSYAPRLAP